VRSEEQHHRDRHDPQQLRAVASADRVGASIMSQDFGLRRFAVLHHAGGVGAGESHYDFLFDSSDTSSLVTFRLPEWPLASGSTHVALKLRDHRRIYLTYEGQISGDRGHVSRVAEGDIYVYEIAGRWLLCHPQRPLLLFEPVRGDEWQVTCSEQPARPSAPSDASTPPDDAGEPGY
jgi:hypothetical protein